MLEPVAYRHVVFTIPKTLRGIFLRGRKMLREQGRCAWKAVPGALLSRATAGDLSDPHPHPHALVSCGA